MVNRKLGLLFFEVVPQTRKVHRVANVYQIYLESVLYWTLLKSV